ncbi:MULTISPECIES: HAMP domain-containing sensor histidine kinase [Clostridium]|uniref:histidine kinase n=1 Tax=Clostridium cadaveris TaxID=1529 RepID=A0A1I2QC32_9CLOT|nr:HAMP domain-containing sensor histidine kinase [Clostridium cadaveris]MDU4953545.1 HAMP domain-containing sensor histidine kinase [Clostridium sp.]MDM8312269.1 HAMP domain-containing sensor histidine kinase [Clostridium cadaveris]MDY4948628.1 HAMP domain-containing sensor histidine kinase [Clostridium cadaveris]NWK12715.1 HAMP domain-containing histidine kinase [Clostridium cadaveris]SFG23181.1 Signal transduction histidine kinase [Clostridium cadaveris]
MNNEKKKGRIKNFFARHVDLITICMVIFTIIAYPYFGRVIDAYKYKQFDKEKIRQQWIYELYEVDNIIFKATNYLNDIPSMTQEELLSEAKVGATYIKSRYYILHKPTGKVYTNEPSLIGNDIEAFLNKDALFYYKVDAANPVPALKIQPDLVNNIKNLGDYEQYYWTTAESIRSSHGNYVIMWDTRERAIKNAFCLAVYIVVFILYCIGIWNIGTEALSESLRKSIWISYIKRFIKYLYHIICSFGDLIRVKSVAFKAIAYIVSTPMFIIIMPQVMYGYVSIFAVVFVFLYMFVLIPLLLKDALGYARIIKATRDMANGNLDAFIKESGSKEVKELASNINKIKTGFKSSIDEQVKNERLKSELVANVSHDLKTPLTSIINYTDLLGREELTAEERSDYLQILNNKSLRLKALIEDLFEVSKMNSGKVELEKGEVDVVELINQSIGELSYMYDEKKLDFRVNSFDQPIMLNLDGKKMARVFENLISNALKYSLDNTRVYVDIEQREESGVRICFKNISAYEMNFDVDEIFDRFKRGDSSRNSTVEGSGLGLAIAKGIVELHRGKMYIEKDGDMFKVFIDLSYS